MREARCAGGAHYNPVDMLIAKSARRVRVATSLPPWLVLAAPVLLLPQIVCSVGTALTWDDGVASLSLFDVDGEGNLPAWWSSTLLLSIAAASAGVAAYQRYVGN